MTYYDITIDKYLKIKDILQEHNNDYFEVQVQLISVLNDLTEDEVLDLPLDKYKAFVAELDVLTQNLTSTRRCPKSLTIAGKKYDVVRDVKYFTAGQYIDYQNLISNKDIYQVLANILAVFIIPEGKKYGQDYDIMEVVDVIKHNMTIGDAYDMAGFFLKKSERSILNTLNYLEAMTTLMQWRTKDKGTKEKLKEARKQLQEYRASFKNGLGYTM